MSRRPRLNDIPADELMPMIHHAFFYPSIERNKTYSHLFKLLENASARGIEEASWVMSILFSSEWISDWIGEDVIDRHLLAKLKWGTTPRAKFYMAQFSRDSISIKDSFLQGHLAAAVEYAINASHGMLSAKERSAGRAILAEGIARKNVDCIHGACIRESDLFKTRDERTSMMLYAAENGNIRSMLYFADAKFVIGTESKRLILAARYASRTGDDYSKSIHSTRYTLDNFRNGNVPVQISFNIGREFDGVYQFWDKENRLLPQWEFCVNVYNAVAGKARRSALYILHSRRELGISRDVANIIARLVYASRKSASDWYSPNIKFSPHQKSDHSDK